MRHSVWDLYNEYRTARLNVKYYSEKLRRHANLNFYADLFIAATSTSSIGGLWFLRGYSGDWIWKVAGAMAVFVSVYRFVKRPHEYMKTLEQRATAYRRFEFDLEGLVNSISTEGAYTASMKHQFESLLSKRKDFALTYVDPQTDKKLLRKCQAEVNEELPDFFVPEKEK